MNFPETIYEIHYIHPYTDQPLLVALDQSLWINNGWKTVENIKDYPHSNALLLDESNGSCSLAKITELVKNRSGRLIYSLVTEKDSSYLADSIYAVHSVPKIAQRAKKFAFDVLAKAQL
jgi:hypothetical protein